MKHSISSKDSLSTFVKYISFRDPIKIPELRGTWKNNTCSLFLYGKFNCWIDLSLMPLLLLRNYCKKSQNCFYQKCHEACQIKLNIIYPLTTRKYGIYMARVLHCPFHKWKPFKVLPCYTSKCPLRKENENVLGQLLKMSGWNLWTCCFCASKH